MALAGEYPPDVLVADIDLGCSEGGIDLALAMRRRRRMAVVFLARNLSPSAIDAVAAIETANIVSKPIDGRQLEAALRLAMQRHATVSRRVSDGTDSREEEWLQRLLTELSRRDPSDDSRRRRADTPPPTPAPSPTDLPERAHRPFTFNRVGLQIALLSPLYPPGDPHHFPHHTLTVFCRAGARGAECPQPVR